MTLSIQYLEWDSQFFQHRCARLLGAGLQESVLHQTLEHAREDRLDCLYHLAEPDKPNDIRVLEEAGFHLVDVRLTFALHSPLIATNKIAPPDAKHTLQNASKDHIPQLRKIALESYERTRFLNDPCFDPGRARELYAVWIENSVRGYADTVLVAVINSQVAGFISLHLPNQASHGSIGLVGVAEEARGQGIGRQLVEQALVWFQSKDIPAVQVVTQASNIGAQRLYQRAGFELLSTGLWYHKWFREDC